MPQMTRVDTPPRASASEVLGSALEKVAASEFCPSSRTGSPFSSTNKRRRRFGVVPRTSECMSPRLETLSAEAPGAPDRDDRTNRPLLLGISDLCCAAPLALRVGLELEA